MRRTLTTLALTLATLGIAPAASARPMLQIDIPGLWDQVASWFMDLVIDKDDARAGVDGNG